MRARTTGIIGSVMCAEPWQARGMRRRDSTQARGAAVLLRRIRSPGGGCIEGAVALAARRSPGMLAGRSGHEQRAHMANRLRRNDD